MTEIQNPKQKKQSLLNRFGIWDYKKSVNGYTKI